MVHAFRNQSAEGALFAYPPLPWIGARFKFDVREKDGSKVLAKTIDNRSSSAPLFHRRARPKNYTIEADVMSEGNKRQNVRGRRGQSALLHRAEGQRAEAGNQLQPGTAARRSGISIGRQTSGITLKARVDVRHDGIGRRARQSLEKRRPRAGQVDHRSAAQNRPSKWLARVFRFSPQDMRVFIDNITVTPN